MKIFLLSVFLSLPLVLTAHPSVTGKAQEEILTKSEVGVAELAGILSRLEKIIVELEENHDERRQAFDYTFIHGPLTTAAYILVHANWDLSLADFSSLVEKLDGLIKRIEQGPSYLFVDDLFEIRILLYARLRSGHRI